MISFLKHKLKSAEHLITVLFWVAMFGVPLLFTDFSSGFTWEKALAISRPNFTLLFAFLINRFILLPGLFFQQKRRAYVVAVAVLVGTLVMGNNLMSTAGPGPGGSPPHMGPPPGGQFEAPPLLPHTDQGPYRPDQPRRISRSPFPRGLVSAFLCILIIGLDTGMKSVVSLSHKEKEHAHLEQENMRNQLAFLRNQVSPHFFMNTLNNIHALIDLDTEEAKEAIIKLSMLMRHLLYDSEAEELLLNKEVEFIRSYVELMKLRYSSKVDIQLDLPAQLPEKHIPPLIFTSILENAFKYGVSYHKPSFIRIALSCSQDTLRFEVENSNHGQLNRSAYSGIGLQNTRTRLDLLYQDHYTLDVEAELETYSVHLLLPI